MANGGIDAVEFGRLIATNEALIATLEKLTDRIETLESQMAEVHKDKAKGQGVVAALLGVGSAVGFLLKFAWDAWMGSGHKP